MQKITALLLALMVTILSTGCGFQLMRTKPIKETYPEIAFVGDKRNVFYKRLFEEMDRASAIEAKLLSKSVQLK